MSSKMLRPHAAVSPDCPVVRIADIGRKGPGNKSPFFLFSLKILFHCILIHHLEYTIKIIICLALDISNIILPC